MFENDGFKGHYMLAFGNHNDMKSGRDYLIEQLASVQIIHEKEKNNNHGKSK